MDDYPQSATMKQTKLIYNQMNDSFYKIQGKDNKLGIGLFSKIKIKNKMILILMTNYHLIDEKFIENNFGIKIKINNEFQFINFSDKRLNYINKEYNLSIIAIEENKKINLNYLEIDDSLYDSQSQIQLNKETIYILNNNKKNQVSVSYGIIRNINKFDISCSCNIKSNGIISPIFNLNSNRLIGIYINNSKIFVKGLFFKYIIIYFTELINLHKDIFEVKNEINILIKVFNEDINKEIYFLNKEYMEYKDKPSMKINNNLNEKNTELYINEKKVKYKKYFQPDKEGQYKIKLKFNANLLDCSYMFANCENIITLNFSICTYFVENMKKMFYKCTNLKEINLLSFDITNVIDISNMFSECENIVNLDLSSFNNKKNTDISYMFYNCKNLCNLNLSNLNFKNVSNLEGMFYKCNKLKNFNLSSFGLKKLDISKDNFYSNEKIIIDSNYSKRNKELLHLLLSNVNQDDNIIKNNINQEQNNLPFLPFISKYDKIEVNSNFILISNDIILILTKYINNDQEKAPNSLSFPQINENIEYSLYNFIIENNDYNNNYSLIKVLNKNFSFENYFKLLDDNFENSDFKSREQFIINENKIEESLERNISWNEKNMNKKYNPGSPIYIKKANQLFLIGIINEKCEIYYFSKKELLELKKKIDKIELRLKFYRIKKIEFQNQKINIYDMSFIFQYDYINLEHLNLENNNLTSEGIKSLQNKSLININYLNLSNNPIDDIGLTYLNYLYNLKELILVDMPFLSDDYFSSLQSNSFIDKINVLNCDKNNLTLLYVNSNYNKFLLPNFNSLKFIFSSKLDIVNDLNILFTLDNICSRILYLDLSNIILTNNEVLILTENISNFKKIKQISISQKNLSSVSKKYLTKLKQKDIKIIFTENEQKNEYNILLGGSTISGKTSYFESYFSKKFDLDICSTLRGENKLIKEINNIKFYLHDCCYWGKRYNSLVMQNIELSDGIILLFDISKKSDFARLTEFVKMINEYYQLENFPVLLVGNKSDLDSEINEEEIRNFLEKEKFIKYFEVSCKTHKNVEESVNYMVNYIYEKGGKNL